MAKFSKFLPSWKLVALSLPIVAIPTTVGAVYLAPVKAEIFHPQSSLELGYQNEYFRPPQVNKYHAPVQPANSHLNVLNQPNYQAAQSYDLLSGDYNLLTQPTEQSFKVGDNDKHLVYKMDFNRQQFINVFATRYQPQLAFNFGVKVDQVNDGDKKVTHSQVFPNLFTSFNMSELNYVKNQTLSVFDYNLNQDFAEYNGTLSLSMEVDMAKNDHFSVTLYLNTTGLSNDNKTSLNVSLLNPEGHIKPVVFWDENTTNNYQNWFWPLPIGPKQPSAVQAPAVDSKAVDKNLYTTQKQSYNNGNNEFQFTNQVLSQEEFNKLNGDTTSPSTSERVSATTSTSQPATSSSTNNTTQDLYTFTLTRSSWQQAFYNMWGDKIPSNPGVKFGFNLNLELLDAKYQQTQNYNVPIYAYFNVNQITQGRSYNQTFLDYDLGAGRENNAGHFQLVLNTKTSLNGTITVTIKAVNKDLRMVSNNDTNLNNQDKYINYDLQNPEITVFKNDSGVATNANNLLPENKFVIDVANKNIQAVNTHVNFRAGNNYGTLKSGSFLDPYLFTARPVSSSDQILDLSNYVEGNNNYAKKSYLKFNFTGTNDTNNQAYINPDSASANVKQLIYFNPGYNEQGISISEYKNPTEIANRAVNNENSFSIPIDKLNTTHQVFEWKKMWVYIAQSRDNPKIHTRTKINQLDANIVGWNSHRRDFGYYIPSFMKAWFNVVMWVDNDSHTQKPDYTRVHYKLVTNAISYSWYKETSSWRGIDNYYFEAARGKAGFKLNSVNLTVNADDSSSTPATATHTPVVKPSK